MKREDLECDSEQQLREQSGGKIKITSPTSLKQSPFRENLVF